MLSSVIRRRGFAFVLLLAAVAIGSAGLAQPVLPTGFAREQISNTLTQGSAMVAAADGRLFVTQQFGQLRVVKNGALLSTPFVTLTVDGTGERGLIGVVLDPDFQTNGYVYVYHTVPVTPPATKAFNRITRFTANGDVAVVGSATIILDLDSLTTATNHNGGSMAFGTDGKLYVGVGDNATATNAQNMTTYKGKILRINKDGTAAAGNPYPGQNSKADRFWGIGVRNPYAMSVHPVDGRIFLLDVGANSFEEINDITVGGKNYGWHLAEGPSANTAFTNPVYSYPHGSGDGVGCAITGGTFFMPTVTNYPSEYYGKFFFMDFCESWINTIDPSANPATASPFGTSTATLQLFLTTGADGNLYYISRAGGALYRLVYNLTTAPSITGQPQDAEVLEGDDAAFSVSSIGSMPFSYQWFRNGAPISGAISQDLVLTAVDESDAGDYSVEVSNAGGQVLSDAATLTVTTVTGLSQESGKLPVLFPNPASANVVTLRIYSESAHIGSAQVISMSGQPAKSINFYLQCGWNDIPIAVGDLPDGLYVATVQALNLTRLKLVVRR